MWFQAFVMGIKYIARNSFESGLISKICELSAQIFRRDILLEIIASRLESRDLDRAIVTVPSQQLCEEENLHPKIC